MGLLVGRQAWDSVSAEDGLAPHPHPMLLPGHQGRRRLALSHPPSLNLLRIGLFCHVVMCICKEFQVTPWFQISSKGLLPASTFVSLAQIPSSGCSTCPLEGTHHPLSLPCFYKCPHLSKCQPRSQGPNLGDLSHSEHLLFSSNQPGLQSVYHLNISGISQFPLRPPRVHPHTVARVRV